MAANFYSATSYINFESLDIAMGKSIKEKEATDAISDAKKIIRAIESNFILVSKEYRTDLQNCSYHHSPFDEDIKDPELYLKSASTCFMRLRLYRIGHNLGFANLSETVISLSALLSSESDLKTKITLKVVWEVIKKFDNYNVSFLRQCSYCPRLYWFFTCMTFFVVIEHFSKSQSFDFVSERLHFFSIILHGIGRDRYKMLFLCERDHIFDEIYSAYEGNHFYEYGILNSSEGKEITLVPIEELSEAPNQQMERTSDETGRYRTFLQHRMRSIERHRLAYEERHLSRSRRIDMGATLEADRLHRRRMEEQQRLFEEERLYREVYRPSMENSLNTDEWRGVLAEQRAIERALFGR